MEEKNITLVITNVKWETESLPDSFTVLLPADTPRWAIMQRLQVKCLQKFGEEPWTCDLKIVGRR